MKAVNIMLCCGAGMSSGFLAQRARKAAQKKGQAVSIEAKSESGIGQYFQDIDILLLGPHYASLKDELAKQAESFNVVVDVIPQDIYGSLDGAGLIAFANRLAE